MIPRPKFCVGEVVDVRATNFSFDAAEVTGMKYFDESTGIVTNSGAFGFRNEWGYSLSCLDIGMYAPEGALIKRRDDNCKTSAKSGHQRGR